MANQPYAGETAILSTMHGEERVIGPLLEQELGLRIRVPEGLNTDQFDTFSHEIERTGSQLDAAGAKIQAVFALVPEARFALASEGSFGPHPQIPVLPLAHEIVVFVDRQKSLRIIGHDESTDTNFAHAIVTHASEAMIFAEKMGYPGHGVIVMGCEGGKPAPRSMLEKGIVYGAELERAVRAAVERCGAALIQADMRAHRNPRRMRAIERATMDLVARLQRRCPVCGRPDFSVIEHIPGLPCADCKAPTYVIQREASICRGCGYRSERAATEQAAADPAQCARCNP
jgi:RNA polymerase subunit RPABC4/transcription elongation factor Spt4